MLTEDEILLTLDNSNRSGYYSHFIQLGHPYSYLIDCRLNIFRGEGDKWAIAAERLGYSERGGAIELEIDYFGNCLVNLEQYNGQITNNYTLYPVEHDDLTDVSYLNPEPKYCNVKGSKIELSTNKQDYLDNDIELKENEPGCITIEEVARLAIINNSDLFRATDEELYKSIPKDLEKILVLDEWHHKDFIEIMDDPMSDEKLRHTYNFNKELTGLHGMDFEAFAALVRRQELSTKKTNKERFDENRPGLYETWKQLSKVIATGDVSFYKPTIPANTHWKNWPGSGSL